MFDSSEYILNTSKDYAIYVAENRAIPAVTDGLKHGQRMALWTLRNRAEKIKTIALTGLLAFAKLYVHGDTSCNNAIGFLAAPYKNNVPLIEGLGEFGSRVQPDAIGAPRYTECRRSKAAQAFLYNDLDIVPLEDNYDGSEQQPKHFLPLIPVVLLNGVSGIAVGWSTNILPHNLKALIEATKCALQDKPIRPLVPSYARYDITVTMRGTNQWELTGRVKLRDTSTMQVTELPPGLSIEEFRRRLIDLEEAEHINGFIDRSTAQIDITIKMKRGSIADWTEAQAVDFLKLRERVTERIVVLDWSGNAIRTYDTTDDLVRDFANWRLGWYSERIKFNLRRDDSELTFWLAVQALFDANFPKRLGGFIDRAALQADVVATVTKKAKLDLTADHLERIVHLATYRWTHAFAAEVEQTIASLQQTISEYHALLASPERLRGLYLAELDDLKQRAASF